jgi:hypothetical protein
MVPMRLSGASLMAQLGAAPTGIRVYGFFTMAWILQNS